MQLDYTVQRKRPFKLVLKDEDGKVLVTLEYTIISPSLQVIQELTEINDNLSDGSLGEAQQLNNFMDSLPILERLINEILFPANDETPTFDKLYLLEERLNDDENEEHFKASFQMWFFQNALPQLIKTTMKKFNKSEPDVSVKPILLDPNDPRQN